jgi:hypothetical protein
LIGGRQPLDGVRGSFSNQKKRSLRLQRSANRDNNDDVDNVRPINQSPHVKGFSFLHQRHLASACQSFPKWNFFTINKIDPVYRLSPSSLAGISESMAPH